MLQRLAESIRRRWLRSNGQNVDRSSCWWIDAKRKKSILQCRCWDDEYRQTAVNAKCRWWKRRVGVAGASCSLVFCEDTDISGTRNPYTMSKMTMKSKRRLLGYSLLRSLIRSHRSLIRLLRTARFARALARSFVCLLACSLAHGAHGKDFFFLWNKCIDFTSFQPTVPCGARIQRGRKRKDRGGKGEIISMRQKLCLCFLLRLMNCSVVCLFARRCISLLGGLSLCSAACLFARRFVSLISVSLLGSLSLCSAVCLFAQWFVSWFPVSLFVRRFVSLFPVSLFAFLYFFFEDFSLQVIMKSSEQSENESVNDLEKLQIYFLHE